MKIRRPILGALTAIAVIAIAMGVAYPAIVSAYTIRQVRETQKATHSTISVIEDCTTPGGTCYQRTQQQTRGVVYSINEVSVYAVTCAKRYGSVARIEVCVRAFLHGRPQPHLDRTAPSTSPPTPSATAGAQHPKAERGSGPGKHKTTPSPPKPTKPPHPVGTPTPSPSPSPVCVLGVVCISQPR